MNTHRRPDTDAVRVFAIAAVFAAHCSQVFAPWRPWHIQNTPRSAWIGQIALTAWPWVIPLFMVLAGASARYSLARRPDRAFVSERTRRLLVPFLVGTFVLIPPQIWVERLAQGRFQGSFPSFLPHFVEGVYPEGNLSAGHLWFLAYLYAYALVTLPLLRGMDSSVGRRIRARLEAALDGPWRMLLLPTGVLAAGQIALRLSFPQTLALVDDWAHHALLLPAYLAGAVLASSPRLEALALRAWSRAVPLALAALAAVSWSVHTSSGPDALPDAWGGEYVVFWTAFALASWASIVSITGAAHRLVRRTPSLLRTASEGVFPFYVLHQTVVVLVAYRVVMLPWSPGPKFVLLAGASLVVTVAVQAAARRWTPTRVVLGARRPELVRR